MGAVQDPALERVIARVQDVYGRWRRDTSIEQMRLDWDALFWRELIPCTTQEREANGVPVRFIRAQGASTERCLIYLHGGGFKMGSLASHHDLMAHLSQAADCQVLGVDYRLLPEHRFPDALIDVLAVYDWLLGQDFDPRQLAIAGDSAGGGLAASALLALRDKDRPLPAAAVLLSAWLDMRVEQPSYQSRAALDPIHQQRMLQQLAGDYLGEGADRGNPLASPLLGDLRGLPPLLLQVGEREVGFDDSAEFYRKARASGVDASFQDWPGMIHVFQQFTVELPQAREAIARIGSFLNSHWN